MYNKELQLIDNQNKSYLLGLFYADGNISLNQNHCRIALHEKDFTILNDIKLEFNFFHIYKESNKSQYILYGGYKQLKKDLINNGCLPQKSTINRKLLRIPRIDDNLIRHFIRGYFDGDGGCTISFTKNKVQKRIYIYSVSLDLLKDIKSELYKNNIKSTITNNNNEIPVFKLSISTISYNEFYNYLYDNSNLLMNRKLIKFKEILKTNFFIQKEAPNCKFCNSTKTVFDGYYTYKNVKDPRILCRNCNKHHIIKSAPVSSDINSGEDELLEA